MLFRIPELVNVQVEKLYNSPESFTPDGRWLVGESAEVSDEIIKFGSDFPAFIQKKDGFLLPFYIFQSFDF